MGDSECKLNIICGENLSRNIGLKFLFRMDLVHRSEAPTISSFRSLGRHRCSSTYFVVNAVGRDADLYRKNEA